MQISLNVTERGPPMKQPFACFKNLPLNIKVTSLENLISKSLNINLLHIGYNLCLTQIWSSM